MEDLSPLDVDGMPELEDVDADTISLLQEGASGLFSSTSRLGLGR